MGLYNYRGAAWFRTYVHTVQEITHLRIICHGIMHHADVYLDGAHLGYHFGGFTPFHFTVPNLAKGRHELIIRVDSTVDWQTLPTDVADWFSYDGIYRSVEVQELSEIYIDHMKIQYTLLGSEARIHIDVGLAYLSHEDKEISFAVHCEGDLFGEAQVRLPAGQMVTVPLEGIIGNIRRWHLGKPELYYFTVSTDEDDLIERIGFRMIEAKNGEILLNGESIYLQGVNRHEEHPQWGFAVPPKLMLKDLDILIDMGCNSVRALCPLRH